MPTVKEIIERLKTYNQDEHIAVHIWSEEDVAYRAEERRISLSTQQVQEIVDELDRRKSAEIGINWTVIDCFLDPFSG